MRAAWINFTIMIDKWQASNTTTHFELTDWPSTLRKMLSSPHAFFSFFYLCQCRLVNSYSIQWDRMLASLLSLMLKLPAIGPHLDSHASWLRCPATPHRSVSPSLLSGTRRGCRPILHRPCARPGSSHFYQEPFGWRIVFRYQGLDTRWLIATGPLSGQS